MQKLGRIRVHATERVEGKRNEFKVMLVADVAIGEDVLIKDANM